MSDILERIKILSCGRVVLGSTDGHNDDRALHYILYHINYIATLPIIPTIKLYDIIILIPIIYITLRVTLFMLINISDLDPGFPEAVLSLNLMTMLL